MNTNLLIGAAIVLFLFGILVLIYRLVRSKPGLVVKDRKVAGWTQSKAFRRLVKNVFEVCDENKTGEISKTELYVGVLLTHVKLAKYLGAGATFPPTRQAVDKIFEASDDDGSGTIDEEEFTKIMVILFSQITSRLAAYYGILIGLVPLIISGFIKLLDYIGVDTALDALDKGVWDEYAPEKLQELVSYIPESVWTTLPETLLSTFMMMFAVPAAWDYLDSHFQNVAEKAAPVEKDEVAEKETKQD
eukprot:CAMPEP_0185740940 /NCGR_PEP_ID=MMETSP1171-20130828/38692_1 /TAXON_ID=374046 /ORGANISM="Helicotheca tamensis, Strain CCMP826" /LENGTH=245 /DNA_ID=CAMNT_0028412871 /DNA_START=596 /DNA_END=1333 /DNA_ORIENTATION=-